MSNKIILTVMGALIKGEEILVQTRTKDDWPGLTLAGGKVEKDETILAAMEREFFEETGLRATCWHFENYIEWKIDDKRHLCLLFKCRQFEGDLLEKTREGFNHWIKIANLKNRSDFSDDFDKILDLLKIDWR